MRWNSLSIPKLQRLHRWSLGIDKAFHPTLYNGCNYLFMLGLKVIHISKRWWQDHPACHDADLPYPSTWCCPGKVHCFLALGHHWHGQVLSSFCVSVSVCPSVHPLLTLWGILVCSLVGWCTVPWSRSPFKLAIFRHLLHSLMLASSGCCHFLNILLCKSQCWG